LPQEELSSFSVPPIQKGLGLLEEKQQDSESVAYFMAG